MKILHCVLLCRAELLFKENKNSCGPNYFQKLSGEDTKRSSRNFWTYSALVLAGLLFHETNLNFVPLNFVSNRGENLFFSSVRK